MKTITVQVREDHLETLARTKPMNALAELIWNAFDAEATDVRVEFRDNDIEGLEEVRITDNGQGLHYDDAFIVFGNLGGSWKRDGFRTHARKRALHGKFGKGRFRAFSIGQQAGWHSVYEESGERFSFSISGNAETLGTFNISNLQRAPSAQIGMTVSIANVPQSCELLRGVKALQEVTDIFALYLRQYPDTRLTYDGKRIDPANSETHSAEYLLDELIMQNGERVRAALAITEWALPGKRGVYFCDEDGFMLQPSVRRLHFRGFSFTAYLKSAYIAELDREGLLQAEELSADVRQLMDAARAKLREHFALREAERAQDVLAQWKEIGLYPYEGEPAEDQEITERRIFEIYATHLNQIFPDFAASTHRNKRLILHLVRELVHADPTRVARILDSLLSFPEEKEEEILELAQN